MKRIITWILSSLFVSGLLLSCNRNIYRVGVASASLEPGSESVSLALAGYAGPVMGRFSITWERCGEASEEASLARALEASTSVADSLRELGIVLLAEDSTCCYAVTTENVLLERNKLSSDKSWLRIGYPNAESYTLSIKRLACRNNRLYALADDGHLYVSKHNSQNNLKAGAVVVKRGGKTAVIVSVDLCGLDYAFTDRVKQAIYRQTGISKEAVLINCSHTHFAPVTQEWRTWGKPNQHADERYLDKVVEPAILQAVSSALRQMTPSTLHFSRDTTRIGYNRSLSNTPENYDNNLDIIRIIPRNGSPESVLFSTGCHPVKPDVGSGRYMLSANYPGYVREQLQAKGYAQAFFLQATGGDINPRSSFKNTGKALTADVLRGLTQKSKTVRGAISFRLDSLDIPLTPLTQEELAQWKAQHVVAVEEPLGGYTNEISVRDHIWVKMMERYYATGTMPSTATLYIQTVKVGNWRIIGLSREATTQYGPAVKALFPNQMVSVLGYTNDVSSYLGTPKHIQANKYEGCESFLWYGQPAPFPQQTFDLILECLTKRR